MLSQDPHRQHLSVVPEPSEPPPFACSVTTIDGTVTIAADGELDMGTCPLLDGEMTRQRDGGAGTLVVDLRGVSFIDSSAIHLLLRWADEADRSRLELRVIPGGGRVQKVFDMTGVSTRLALVEPG